MSRWLGPILRRSTVCHCQLSTLRGNSDGIKRGKHGTRLMFYRSRKNTHIDARLVNPIHSVCHRFNPALSDPIRALRDRCVAAAQSSTPYCHDDMRGFNIFCWINTVNQTAGVWPNEACNSFPAPLETTFFVCVQKNEIYSECVVPFRLSSFLSKAFQ